MNIYDFFKHVEKLGFLPEYQMFSFDSGVKDYPILFTQLCISWILEVCSIEIFTLDVQNSSFDQLQSILATTFLGTKKYYWILGLDSIDTRVKKKWITYFNSYKGPHILFFSNESEIKTALHVDISIKLYTNQVVDILKLFTKLKEEKITHFVSVSSKYIHPFTIDIISLLAYYIPVVGKDESFFYTYLPKMIDSNNSLFQLSQFLFSNQPNDFFALWKKIGDEYAISFWTIFWSEQFSRAAMYVFYMRKKEVAKAKLIGARLPFSFLNKDWQLYSVQELKNAHQVINKLDVEFKNGRGIGSIDLLYIDFLYSNFK